MQTAPNIPPNRPRSASSFPLLGSSLSKGLVGSKASPSHPPSFKTRLSEGRTLDPSTPQKHSPMVPVSPNSPKDRALTNGGGSAEQVPFFSRLWLPRPPKPEREQTPTAPVPLSRPAPSSTLRNHKPPYAIRTSGVNPSLLLRRPPPPSRTLSPGSPGPAPELRAPATTPHPPRAPARAASPRRPALTREAHDIMEHGTGDFQEQNPPTRFQ